MHDALLTGLFRALVLRIGGVEAAEACLQARWGQASKGHISRMCGGQSGVALEAVVALEDALADHPVTQYLALRAGLPQAPKTGRGLIDLMAHAALSGGQVQVAVAQAIASDGPGGLQITEAEAGEIGAAAHELRRIAEDLMQAAARITDAGGLISGGAA